MWTGRAQIPWTPHKQNCSDEQDPTPGPRWLYHCFPPKCSNLRRPFLKTRSPKEGAGEHGSWELTECSKELGQRLLLEVCTPSPSISETIRGEIFQRHSGQVNLPLKRDKWLLCWGLNQITRHFGQQLPTFGPQELIGEFVGFCESEKSKSVSALHPVFQMGSLYARNLRMPQIREVWKLVESV